MRIRNFGFLANRRRATLWPLCFHLLGAAPQTEQDLATANDVNYLRFCPKCGGPLGRTGARNAGFGRFTMSSQRKGHCLSKIVIQVMGSPLAFLAFQ